MHERPSNLERRVAPRRSARISERSSRELSALPLAVSHARTSRTSRSHEGTKRSELRESTSSPPPLSHNSAAAGRRYCARDLSIRSTLLSRLLSSSVPAYESAILRRTFYKVIGNTLLLCTPSAPETRRHSEVKQRGFVAVGSVRLYTSLSFSLSRCSSPRFLLLSTALLLVVLVVLFLVHSSVPLASIRVLRLCYFLYLPAVPSSTSPLRQVMPVRI